MHNLKGKKPPSSKENNFLKRYFFENKLYWIIAFKQNGGFLQTAREERSFAKTQFKKGNSEVARCNLLGLEAEEESEGCPWKHIIIFS